MQHLLVAAWAELGPWLADAELFSRFACRDRTVGTVLRVAEGRPTTARSYMSIQYVYFLAQVVELKISYLVRFYI